MNTESKSETVLVTGGPGFVVRMEILGLLERGYVVKASLCSLARQDNVVKAIHALWVVNRSGFRGG